jgi:indoleamine 2,3-dioxygenase
MWLYHTAMSADGWAAPLPGVDERRGFLPGTDPLEAFDVARYDRTVGDYLERLDELGETLPERLRSGDLGPAVRSLDPPPSGALGSLTRWETVRLRQVTAFLASAYVHAAGHEPVDRLPAGVAVPLFRSSARLGVEAVLAYDVLCLHNFRRRDANGGFAVENLGTVQRFSRHDDERWFVAVHVAIEAAAAPALTACARAQRAIAREEADDRERLRTDLETVASSLAAQTDVMRRMTEGNDPAVFASEFRPYFDGFDGVVYEGVDPLGGEPQSFRGASGAQSAVLPAIDATLGVDHDETALLAALGDMRSYVPPAHRRAIRAFETGPDVRRYVASRREEPLVAAFNRCVDRLGEFRRVHFQQVVQYVREASDETAGTGGTDFVPFLERMREETEARKL